MRVSAIQKDRRVSRSDERLLSDFLETRSGGVCPKNRMPILLIQVLHLFWAVMDKQLWDRPALYIEKRAAAAATSSKSKSSSKSSLTPTRSRSATQSTTKVTPSATIASGRSATSSIGNSSGGNSASTEDQLQLQLSPPMRIGLIVAFIIIILLIPVLYFIKYCYKEKRSAFRFLRPGKSFLGGFKPELLASDRIVEEFDGVGTLQNSHQYHQEQVVPEEIADQGNRDYTSFSRPEILTESRLFALERLEYPTADLDGDEDSRLGWEEADQLKLCQHDLIEIVVDPRINTSALEAELAIQTYQNALKTDNGIFEIVAGKYTQDLDGFQCLVEKFEGSESIISLDIQD